MDSTPTNPQQRISLTLVILTSLAWFVFPSVDAWVAFSPLWIGIVVWQIHKRTRWAIMSLLAPAFVSVPITYFMFGVLGYATGTAQYQLTGRMGQESMFNISRYWRCRMYSDSCMGSVHDPFTNEPNNYAIELLTRCFGPMPGAYAGPYPSREQAFEAIAASLAYIPTNEFDGSTRRVEGGEIALSGSLLDEIRQRGMKGENLRLHLYEEECLLVADSCPAHSLLLIDLKREDVFAKYGSPPEGFTERRLFEIQELFRR